MTFDRLDRDRRRELQARKLRRLAFDALDASEMVFARLEATSTKAQQKQYVPVEQLEQAAGTKPTLGHAPVRYSKDFIAEL